MIISTGMDGALRYRQDNLNRATRLCQKGREDRSCARLSAEPFETRFISPETIVPASRFTDSHRLCWSESAMMLARARWKGFIRHCGKLGSGFLQKEPNGRVDDHLRRLQATGQA
ncbi:hypothetical protein NKH10_24075 [Mesorhizobium sp. M1340]|uniref:hypothetical protein n=1 Tax=Mesorhizobium sp. M1340 TaxID=2957087 RepID=UPI00333CE527